MQGGEPKVALDSAGPDGKAFGRHVRSCRKARGYTQETLAETSGLSADTIRRLEHGSFSPSLVTLHKLCAGLDISLSTLFEAYELGERRVHREVLDLLGRMGLEDQLLLLRLIPLLLTLAREGGNVDE